MRLPRRRQERAIFDRSRLRDTGSGSILKLSHYRDTRWFGGNAGGDLYLRFALTLSNESGASTFHAQAYIPTQPAQAIEDTRISRAHEDPGRQESYFPPPRQGAETGLGETRFPRIAQWRGPERRRTRCCASHNCARNLAPAIRK